MLPGLGSAIVGSGALANPQFVGGAIAGKAGAAAGNTTIPLNSGLTGGIASAAQSGDFVLAAFGTSSLADRTLSITDGTSAYTLVGSELFASDLSGTDANLRVAYKFITSDTDTTFGPTGNADDAGITAVYVFRGVNPTTPIDATPTTFTSSNFNPLNFAAITPVTLDAMVVAIAMGAESNLGNPWTDPSGYDGFLSAYQADTNNGTLGLAHKSGWTSGSYDPPNFNIITGCRSICAMTIALRPAP